MIFVQNSICRENLRLCKEKLLRFRLRLLQVKDIFDLLTSSISSRRFLSERKSQKIVFLLFHQVERTASRGIATLPINSEL